MGGGVSVELQIYKVWVYSFHKVNVDSGKAVGVQVLQEWMAVTSVSVGRNSILP